LIDQIFLHAHGSMRNRRIAAADTMPPSAISDDPGDGISFR
jgi:hypothetical protein